MLIEVSETIGVPASDIRREIERNRFLYGAAAQARLNDERPDQDGVLQRLRTHRLRVGWFHRIAAEIEGRQKKSQRLKDLIDRRRPADSGAPLGKGSA